MESIRRYVDQSDYIESAVYIGSASSLGGGTCKSPCKQPCSSCGGGCYGCKGTCRQTDIDFGVMSNGSLNCVESKGKESVLVAMVKEVLD